MQDAKDRAAEVSRNREEQKRKDAQREKEENDRTSKEAHDKFNAQRAERKAKEQEANARQAKDVEEAERVARKERREQRIKAGNDEEANRGAGKTDRRQAKAERVKRIEEKEKDWASKRQAKEANDILDASIRGTPQPSTRPHGPGSKRSPLVEASERGLDTMLSLGKSAVGFGGVASKHVKGHIDASWNDIYKVPMGHKDAAGNPLQKSQMLGWMQPGTPRNAKSARVPKGSFLDIGGFADRSPMIFGPAPKRAPAKKGKKRAAPKQGRSMLDDMLFF
jgi:hypothetical protein